MTTEDLTKRIMNECRASGLTLSEQATALGTADACYLGNERRVFPENIKTAYRDLREIVTDYSEAVARYNAAVSEMIRLQGTVPEREYAELKTIVAATREEAARTREVLRSFRERSWRLRLNAIAVNFGRS